MISKPTNRQLIDAVCAELSGKVLPTITDGGTKVVMEMALSVLGCAAVDADLGRGRSIEQVVRRHGAPAPGRAGTTA